MKIKYILAVLTIMFPGFNLALPNEGWAAPLQLVRGVYIHNVLAALWFCIFLLNGTFGKMRSFVTARERHFAGMIALLGVVGLLSTIVSVIWYPLAGAYGFIGLDFGYNCRLFLLSFYFLLMLYWAYKDGPAFIIRWFLVGLSIGGLINIFYSFQNPYKYIEVLPFLYNRNGAAGILALGIALSAWMWVIRDKISNFDRFVSIAASIVGITAVAISYSKTGFLIGSVGIVTWMIILGAAPLKIIRSKIVITLLLSGSLMFFMVPTENITDVLDSINKSIQTKFYAVSIEESGSVSDRYYYYVAVGEIFINNPIIGVGRPGIFSALSESTPFRQGLMDPEDAEDAGQGRTNPHNSFLYYAMANGLPGIVLVFLIYIIFIKAVFQSIHGSRVLTYSITGCIFTAYLFYGNSLPNMFNTEILYLPAAAAMAIPLRRKRTS